LDGEVVWTSLVSRGAVCWLDHLWIEPSLEFTTPGTGYLT
jgi:hypothetical protein